jgi:hypothetical protein
MDFFDFLRWFAYIYPMWMLLGYIAFRITNWFRKGKTLWEHEVTYGRSDFRHLTPKMGMCYMFFGGGFALFFTLATVTFVSIGRWHKKQFANGINHSLGANRFFGIK